MRFLKYGKGMLFSDGATFGAPVDAVREKLVENAFETAGILIAATVILTLTLVLASWNLAHPVWLGAWAGAQLLAAGALYLLVRDFSRARHRRGHRAWARLHTLGTAAAGTCWGAVAFLAAADWPLGQQLLLFASLIGICTAAAQASSGIPASVHAMLLPAGALAGIALASSTSIDRLAAATVLIVYLVVLGWLSRKQYRDLVDNLTLVHDNHTLVSGLTDSNQRLADEIFEHQQTEQALTDSNNRFRALFDDNPSIAFSVTREGRILDVNRFGAEQLGYGSTGELVGSNLLELVSPSESDGLRRSLENASSDDDSLQRSEHAVLDHDGNHRWVRSTLRRLKRGGSREQILVLWEDLSETHQLQDALSWQASHDTLTGLYNRAEFEHRVTTLAEEAAQDEGSHVLCYVDLDQFKLINDTCGHVAGDELLRNVAQLLKRRTRKGDTLARLGGDEFGILAMDCDIERLESVAEEHRAAIEEYRFAWNGQSYQLSASFGLALIESGERDAKDILARADAACHAAKEGGGNRVHVYRARDDDLARRHGEMQWATRIPQALEAGRLVLYRQPIAPITQNELGEHYEILVRMLDDDHQIVPPGVFLPAAERYNLSNRIDEWVVTHVLEWLESNPPARVDLALCSINLSGLSLGSRSFLDRLESRLKASTLDPGKLCFEVTETAAIGNLENARVFIQRIKSLGCRFALDDFGSGLSSFGYLKNLPVDYLKIDGQFVREMVSDEIDAAMVRSINDIGHVMGKYTIAEFVEDQATLDALTRMGVDFAQGYFLGKPAPLPDFAAERRAAL